jgi:hypothetical protein
MSSTILGSGKKLEDFMLKTEVFDTPGNFTFNHPNPGNALEVSVTIISGAGGTSHNTSGTNAGNGGDSIWDVGNTNVTVTGGTGATSSAPGLGGSPNGFDGRQLHGSNGHNGNYQLKPTGLPYGSAIATLNSNALQNFGGSGGYKVINFTTNQNVDLTVGAGGGSPDGGVGKGGAIIVQYAKAAAGFPTVSVTNKPEWEHFGTITWREAANNNGITVTSNVVTNIPINTESLDTGNKVVVNGDDTFTLQAGTYEFDFNTTAYNSDAHDKIFRLYNITDSVTERNITYSETAPIVNMKSVISLSTSKTFKLDTIWASTTPGSHELGSYVETTLGDLIDKATFNFKWRPNS